MFIRISQWLNSTVIATNKGAPETDPASSAPSPWSSRDQPTESLRTPEMKMIREFFELLAKWEQDERRHGS
jgi:hypothetical protein